MSLVSSFPCLWKPAKQSVGGRTWSTSVGTSLKPPSHSHSVKGSHWQFVTFQVDCTSSPHMKLSMYVSSLPESRAQQQVALSVLDQPVGLCFSCFFSSDGCADTNRDTSMRNYFGGSAQLGFLFCWHFFASEQDATPAIIGGLASPWKPPSARPTRLETIGISLEAQGFSADVLRVVASPRQSSTKLSMTASGGHSPCGTVPKHSSLCQNPYIVDYEAHWNH